MYVFYPCTGPFSNSEMADWFSHGYFTMGLLVKRTTDDAFQPLGEVIKQWGRVPFIPGPQPPPFKVVTMETVTIEFFFFYLTKHASQHTAIQGNSLY